ncbi:MAG: iron chelate uptake ABC transporter family permease subunit [Peptococcaceae bacterium]|nr:iron chelate uptake ABC transporter family permease subunit [Peptococcaceae bacterium]
MRRPKVVLGILLFVLGSTIVICTTIGPAPIGPVEVLGILLGRVPGAGGLIPGGDWPETFETIVFQLRLARVVLAALVGAALAASGVVLQGLLRNPMADPYILGISSGAALGASLGLLLGLGGYALGIYTIPLLAFLGGVGTAFAVYALARVDNRVPVSTLLLAGIAVGSFLSALTSLVMVTSGSNLHEVIFWLMGGFAGRGWDHVKVLLPYVLIGFIPMYLYARELNVMLLGDETAQHVGIEVERVKRLMFVTATLVTASAVAVSGIIGFVGLIIPHAVRLLVGPDHRILLPTSALVGAIFLAAADTVARTAVAPLEIPVGVITALCGGPFFIYLLRRKKDPGF